MNDVKNAIPDIRDGAVQRCLAQELLAHLRVKSNRQHERCLRKTRRLCNAIIALTILLAVVVVVGFFAVGRLPLRGQRRQIVSVGNEQVATSRELVRPLS